MKTFTYLSQFRLNVRYRLDKTYIILNTLSRLFNKNINDEEIDSFDVNFYVYHEVLIEIFHDFRQQILNKYRKNLV